MNSTTPTADLLEALAVRPIFGRDFENLKRSLSIQMERAYDSVASAGSDPYRTLYSAELTRPYDFRGLRTFAKRLTAMEPAAKRRGVSDDLYAACLAYSATWLPVADAIEAAKAVIVRGRKPSTEPRKTEPRTIENTGTCSICSRNIKLDGGKIVDHGFTIKYGIGRNGKCFGVGFPAIEVSPEGLDAYITALTTSKAAKQTQVDSLRAKDQNATEERYNEFKRKMVAVKVFVLLRAAESENAALVYALGRATEERAAWAARPLPGTSV